MTTLRDRIRRAFPVGLWGVFILVLSAVALLFEPDTVTTVLGFGTAAGVLGAGLTVFAARRGAAPRGQVAVTPDLSVATVVLAIGVSVAILGGEAGAWLVGIGAGLAAAGLGGVVREKRAERRARGDAA